MFNYRVDNLVNPCTDLTVSPPTHPFEVQIERFNYIKRVQVKIESSSIVLHIEFLKDRL